MAYVSIMNRIIWIDIAKAICIVLVVIGHYIPDIHPIWYGEMNKIIYTFHMPLFMFASGFVYMATKNNVGYGKFLWRKVKRLMIPYLTVSLVVVTIKLCTQEGTYVENPVTAMSYLKIFYLPEAGYFLWFIWALWWMFVLVPLFVTPYFRLGLFIVSLFLPMVSSFLPEEFCIKEFSRMLQYFMAGVVVYEWKEYLKCCKRIPVIVVLFVFCIVEAMPYLGGGGNSVLTAAIGISLVLRISYAVANHVKTSTWGNCVMTISSASYIIYLFHTTFEGGMKALVLKLPYISNLSNEMFFTIGAIMVVSSGIIFPVLLYKYILGRYNVLRILFGLK